MKKYILFLSLVFLASVITAQSTSPVNKEEYKIRKNAVYAQNFIIFPSIYYDRTISIVESFGLIPRVGISLGAIPIIGLNAYYGTDKHKVELGAAYWDLDGVLVNINYRYTGRKGLLLKLGLEYIPGEEGAPVLGIGYAF